MNPRLFSYMAGFDAFLPDKRGSFGKKICLKVSDYRSAYIQAKILVKKCLWVSEFRIESGLNCGGHAFATQGKLLGPILQEFKEKRLEFEEELFGLYSAALMERELEIPKKKPKIRYSAQGGVGTTDEHEFLLKYYGMDSVGWGTPFMLVPEAINIDPQTLQKLKDAEEDDLYLSGISPLGIGFNNLRGNSKDLEKEDNIRKGKPGSPCTKMYASLNKEFTDKSICVASRGYQTKKLAELDTLNLTVEERKERYSSIVEKSCICVGLGTSALLNYNLDTSREGKSVSVCPGPNLAYFSEEVSLSGMVNHIYGRNNIIKRTDRPNFFLKELELYLNYLKNELLRIREPLSEKQKTYFLEFVANLKEGIDYYKRISLAMASQYPEFVKSLNKKLETYIPRLNGMNPVS